MNRIACCHLAAVLGLLFACGDDRPSAPVDAGPPVRELSFAGVEFSSTGISEAIEFAVPDGTRSLSVIVYGQMDGLYGLAELTTADGAERVELETRGDLIATMTDAYFAEQVGAMPGAMYQSVRLGMFPHVYPNRPGDPLPAGTMSLRVATTKPSSPVRVELLMPKDDGAQTLHLNVFAVSNEFSYTAEELPFMASLTDVLGAANIDIAVDQVINFPDSGFSNMTDFTEPQEPPTSMSSQLALLGGALVDNPALNVFVVDTMPLGVAGWSLGTPGPPVPDTYYSGVVVNEIANGGELGRVLAHEIAHYVGLSHVINRGVSGAVYHDPIDDTSPGSGNLMEGGGTLLTAGQAYVLQRSALLTID